MPRAEWVNGKRKISGMWCYSSITQRFYVTLDMKDRITGQRKSFEFAGDSPEWGNWKLQREKKPNATRQL